LYILCVAITSVAFQGLLLPLAAEKLGMVDNSQNVMKTFSDYRDDQEMQLIQIRLFPGQNISGKTNRTESGRRSCRADSAQRQKYSSSKRRRSDTGRRCSGDERVLTSTSAL